jgi:hypothetical protein
MNLFGLLRWLWRQLFGDNEALERVARATGRTRTEAVRLAIRELYNAMRDALKVPT